MKEIKKKILQRPDTKKQKANYQIQRPLGPRWIRMRIGEM